MLSKKDRIIKRIFDLSFSFLALLILFIPILLLVFIASISTRSFGLFSQTRVGQNAIPFTMYKIKTMKSFPVSDRKWKELDKRHITVKGDLRVTDFGKFLRKHKLDEFPQLFNVLIGEMSFVGPRPDVPGYADKLEGEDKVVLSVKPGITGSATLYFRNEEELLAMQSDPIDYNNNVIWPKKVELNKEYIKNWSFKRDIDFICKTIFS